MSQRPRRFWKEVSVQPQTGSHEAGTGFGVALDGRLIKTPGKRTLTLPTAALAQAVADEWAAVEKELDPFFLPLTQMANTLLDRIGPQRAEIIAELLRYLDADAICYQAAEPEDLVARQQATWAPIRDRVRDALGVAPVVATGLMPQVQPPAVHAAVEQALLALDDVALTVFQVVAGAVGSWCIALALTQGHLDADQAYRAACLDELYQAELWGEDWEAQDRRAALLADLLAAERFLTLAR